jgi:hypothetical protein
MAFPPRPRASRTEPSFAPLSAAREPVPVRQPAPRPSVVQPVLREAPAGREAARLATEPRRPTEARAPGFSAGERLSVSSEITTGASGGKRPGMMRGVIFAALLMLAGVGAITVYQWIDGNLLH